MAEPAPTSAPASPAAPPAGPPTQPGTSVPAPIPAPEAGAGGIVGWLILAAIVALFVAAGVKLARKKKAEQAALPERRVRPAQELLEEEEEEEEPEAVPGETAAELEARRAAARAEKAAEQARKKAEYDARKKAKAELEARRAEELAKLTPDERAAREAEHAKADAEARAREEAEAAERRARKAAEDERKKAEYRARKEAERAEKEAKKRAAEEAEAARLRAIEDEKRAAEEAKRAAEEARKKRAEAEAGKTLSEGLSRTREGGFVARLAGLFGGARAEVSDATIGELEEILFTADIGVKTSMTLVEHARERLRARELSDPEKLKATIRGDIEGILSRAMEGDRRETFDGVGLPLDGSKKPWVIMVVGVNGAGKTTTIGKLAAKLKARGKSVVLAAGDTFRAAATEQLDVWAVRAEVPLVKGPENGDPGAVVFDAVKKGVAEGLDVVICDTAGRLHTKAPLMEELKRVKKVVGKAREGAPDEVLLVLDATMGQNAIQQARQFHEALGVTGIVLTKLDGTAKGGVVIGISDELKIPVRLVGIGESLGDLRPFEPKEFVSALFG